MVGGVGRVSIWGIIRESLHKPGPIVALRFLLWVFSIIIKPAKPLDWILNIAVISHTCCFKLPSDHLSIIRSIYSSSPTSCQSSVPFIAPPTPAITLYTSCHFEVQTLTPFITMTTEECWGKYNCATVTVNALGKDFMILQFSSLNQHLDVSIHTKYAMLCGNRTNLIADWTLKAK